MNRTARAFTLVELLVVVGVIGVLMTLMTPSYIVMMDMSEETACGNNLSLINKAIQSYILNQNSMLPRNDWINREYYNYDANDLLPGRASTLKWWCNKVYTYGTRKSKVYICPSDVSRADSTELVACGYGFNNTLTNPESGGGSDEAGLPGDGVIAIDEIEKPERTALVGHCSNYTEEPAIVEQMAIPDYWPVGHMARYDSVGKTRLGRFAYIMADGHVVTKTFADSVKFKNKDGKLELFHR